MEPEDIAILAKDFLENTNRDGVDFCLLEIGIRKGEIGNSNTLLTYYVNVISHLISKDKLYDLMSLLVDKGIVFAKRWAEKLANDAQKLKSVVEKANVNEIFDFLKDRSEMFTTPIIGLYPPVYKIIPNLKIGRDTVSFAVVLESQTGGLGFHKICLIKIESPETSPFTKKGKLTVKQDKLIAKMKEWQKTLKEKKQAIKYLKQHIELHESTRRFCVDTSLKIVIGRRNMFQEINRDAIPDYEMLVNYDRLLDSAERSVKLMG